MDFELFRDGQTDRRTDRRTDRFDKHSTSPLRRGKTPAPIRNGTLQPIRIKRAFQLVGIDIIILRTSKSGNKYALACVDYLTNWVEVSAMKNMTVEEELIISRHGCPEGLISDSGSQFIGNVVKDLCDSFHIKKVESSPYHQQANG